MGDLIKYLRIYPGLQSDTEIIFKNISFKSLNESELDDDQISEINNQLSNFVIEKIDSEGDDITLAKKPLLTTLVEAEDLYSFEKVTNPYEHVLFFISNLELAIPPVYENISFRILENGRAYMVENPKSLRIDPYWSTNIYMSQFHFVENDSFMQSKLLKIFKNMPVEVYKRNSNPENDHVGNRNLISSLYWYNKACKMSEHLEERSAIIYFATAFEAFFNISNRFKKESLGFAVQRYLGDNNRLRKWVNDFYNARNTIVHGSYIERDELKAVKGTNYVHSIVAKQVFQECILRQLHLTEGLDYLRTDRNISYEYIVNNLLTLNEEKFNDLKNRAKYSYITISSDEYVASDFFKTLISINPFEYIETGNSEKDVNNYIDLTTNLATIAVDWINDVIEKDNYPSIRISPHRDNSDFDESYYPDELKKITNYFEGFKPNDAKDLFDTWYAASNHFTNLYLTKNSYFTSDYKEFGLNFIFQFVVRTATRLANIHSI